MSLDLSLDHSTASPCGLQRRSRLLSGWPGTDGPASPPTRQSARSSGLRASSWPMLAQPARANMRVATASGAMRLDIGATGLWGPLPFYTETAAARPAGSQGVGRRRGARGVEIAQRLSDR